MFECIYVCSVNEIIAFTRGLALNISYVKYLLKSNTHALRKHQVKMNLNICFLHNSLIHSLTSISLTLSIHLSTDQSMLSTNMTNETKQTNQNRYCTWWMVYGVECINVHIDINFHFHFHFQNLLDVGRACWTLAALR